MLTQVDQRPPVLHGTLADNFFAKVLKDHALVMYENHPQSLVDGLRRQITLKQKDYEKKEFFAYESPVANYRRELIEMVTLLCDAEMASHGYPLQQTKRFEKYSWPLFYLLDADESNAFAISGAHSPEPRHFYPYSLPAGLTINYHNTSKEVYQHFTSNHVLVTGNSKLAPDWARQHMQRARNTGLFSQLLVIGEADDYLILKQREFALQVSDFKPTDPIVIGKRKFYRSFGSSLGDITIERYYVVTAYDPTRAELEILKGFTSFY